MEIVQTKRYLRDIKKAKFSTAEIEALENEIIADPLKGDPIPQTNGLRKIRFAAKGKGKRGGARAIYFYMVIEDTAYMLRAFAKSDQEDLSDADKKAAAKVIETEIMEQDDGESED